MQDLFDPSPIVEAAPWSRNRKHLFLSAATWPAALGVLLARAARAPGLTEHSTSLIALWLVALGAVGCPVYALRLIGPRLTVRLCLLLSSAGAAVAVLLTALFASGAFAPSTPIQLLGLIVPMAVAVQSFNAAESRSARLREIKATEAECERRVAAALEAPCPKCQLRDQIDREAAKLNALTRFRNLSPEEAAELVDAVLAVASADGRDGGR